MGSGSRGNVAIVTGSGGLVGAQAVRKFAAQGLQVVGIDNDMRSYYFGNDASTRSQVEALKQERSYRHVDADIRDVDAIRAVFQRYGNAIAVVVHCAAQTSYDWAAREPATDFTVNANGTQVLLEATRTYARQAVFVFVSTNKVYGDRPNELPMFERRTRLELAPEHIWSGHGIPETMSIDGSLHSLFGASKVAADVLVQEYGRHFGMNTVCFRGGCVTGPGHSGTQLHGSLADLMTCAVTGTPYAVFGYGGKQVRDTIHVWDLVEAFWCFFQSPSAGAVFNIGGGRQSNCSVLEAIDMAQALTGRAMQIKFDDTSRVGDHRWWITDTRKFRKAYPEWKQCFNVPGIMVDIHGQLTARHLSERISVAAE